MRRPRGLRTDDVERATIDRRLDLPQMQGSLEGEPRGLPVSVSTGLIQIFSLPLRTTLPESKQGRTPIMNALTKKFRVVGIAVCVTATAVILGCGDDSGLATRYKVSGTVKYKGQPVPKGTVVFEPTNPPIPQGRHANGTIENGSYTLTTSSPNDGALPGEYRVIIMSSDLDVAALAKDQGHGGMLHQGDESHVKALKASKNPLPEKYAQTDKTPLKATVKAQSNSLDFDLTD
jgi:hypothetical protein